MWRRILFNRSPVGVAKSYGLWTSSPSSGYLFKQLEIRSGTPASEARRNRMAVPRRSSRLTASGVFPTGVVSARSAMRMASLSFCNLEREEVWG